MSSAVSEKPPWKALRWLGIVGLVFTLQVALIFWLSDRRASVPRRAAPAPPLVLPRQGLPESVPLESAVLFALPTTNGFAGPAWLMSVPVAREPAESTEQERWLALTPDQLLPRLDSSATNIQPGAVFSAVDPEPSLPERPAELLFPERSTLRVKGALAQRQLLVSFDLPSFPHTDLLTNTVVLMMVDASGRPASANLISGSGSQAADQWALDQARRMRFNRLPDTNENTGPALAQMVWGYLVFDWHTRPASDTNAISRTP